MKKLKIYSHSKFCSSNETNLQHDMNFVIGPTVCLLAAFNVKIK